MIGISVTERTIALAVRYTATITWFLDSEIKFSIAMAFAYSCTSYFLSVLHDQELFIFSSHVLIYLIFYYIICMNLVFRHKAIP